MAGSGYQPQLTWPNIISTLLAFTAMAGGSWALIQTQLGSLDQRHAAIVSGIEAKENIRHEDLIRRESELRDRILRLENEIDIRTRGNVFVTVPEFRQFVLRFETVLSQLQTLERTRPTTGELQAVSQAIEQRVIVITDELKNRVRREEVAQSLLSLRREIDLLEKKIEQRK